MNKFEEILSNPDHYPITVINNFRYEWQVEGIPYFMVFDKRESFNNFKAYTIKFGVMNKPKPFADINQLELVHVLKLVRTLGHCVTKFAGENKFRYLFYEVEVGRADNISTVDTVRSRMFVRWYKQNYPADSIFEFGKKVVVDYYFLFYNDISLFEECHEYCEINKVNNPNLNPFLMDMILPVAKRLPFVVKEFSEGDKFKHKLYIEDRVYDIKVGLDGFSLERGGSIYPFNDVETFDAIITQNIG